MTFAPFIINVDRTGIHYVITPSSVADAAAPVAITSALADLPSHPAGTHWLRLEVNPTEIIYHYRDRTGTIQWAPNLLALREQVPPDDASSSERGSFTPGIKSRLLFTSGLAGFLGWYHVFRDEIFTHYLPADGNIGSNLLLLCRYPLVSLRLIDDEKSAFYHQLLIFIEHYHKLFKPGATYDVGQLVLNLQAQQYLLVNKTMKSLLAVTAEIRQSLAEVTAVTGQLRTLKEDLGTSASTISTLVTSVTSLPHSTSSSAALPQSTVPSSAAS